MIAVMNFLIYAREFLDWLNNC